MDKVQINYHLGCKIQMLFQNRHCGFRGIWIKSVEIILLAAKFKYVSYRS
jgi:hypothetical protein